VAERLGHEVAVANPRQVALISGSDRKSDRTDAETLTRLGRADVALLRPIRHRTEQAQKDLEVLRARHALVRARTLLVNHVRGALKSWGTRVRSSSSEAFEAAAREQLPPELVTVFSPTLTAIGDLTAHVRDYDRRLAALGVEQYPQTALLRQVTGVGPVTSLAFVLTIEDPSRFRRNRQVGAYLGLRPRMDQSGQTSRQLGIAKSGDRMLRSLLVQSAHYILGPHGPDTTLRRYGEALMARGAGNAKKRAIVAVARRLAVLLLRLWKTGEVYEPLHAPAANAQAGVGAL
jgi:transposase